MKMGESELSDLQRLTLALAETLDSYKDIDYGIKITALKMATEAYVQLVRTHVAPEHIEMFENTVRQTEITIDRLVGDGIK